MRVVVNLVGDAAHGRLAESTFVEMPFVYGGEFDLYRLAFALTQLGHEVELRGWLDRQAFEQLRAQLGIAPRVELPARRPQPGELVVVPEGWRDPLDYLRLLLSPARLALAILAPPGLVGWPMGEADWTLPDPLTVEPEAVAQPAHFQAMAELGFALLTNSAAISAAAQAAGADCAFVGKGRPVLPEPRPEGPRPIDAVALATNRWSALAEAVAAELPDLNVELIGESPNDVVLERMSCARTLIWPSRVEGDPTISWEARLMGCVPVALPNRFAVGLSEEHGAVVVDRLEDMAPAVRALVADEERRRELSQRGMHTAPEEVRWDLYVDRVRGFVDSVDLAPTPGRAAVGAMGDALEDWLEQRAAESQSRLEELAAELDRVRSDRDRLHYELHDATQRIARPNP